MGDEIFAFFLRARDCRLHGRLVQEPVLHEALRKPAETTYPNTGGTSTYGG
jgi:hypothetical protein